MVKIDRTASPYLTEKGMPTLHELMLARDEQIDSLHHFQPGRTALLVIDMQHGFLDPGAALEVPPGREIIPRLRQLIDVCRRHAVPVIFTEFVYASSVPCLRGNPFGSEHLPAPGGGTTGFGLPSSNCLIGPGAGEGPNAAQTIAELAPLPGELVIQGHTYDKFYGTPLDLALRSQDIRFLMVTGVVTDVCVNATLMSAAMRDYRVTAVTDGVATLWPELQEACFAIWKRKFARLRTTEEVIAEIHELH
jgi:ureidoacrylate peracid hydrolase